MAGVAPQQKTVGVPTSTTQHLQGLLTRKTATAEPKSIAQYFNHVADAVRVNEELTGLRKYNLKRRWQVTARGYEAVINRKKRTSVSVSRPSVTGPSYLIRAAPIVTIPSSTAPISIQPTAAATAQPPNTSLVAAAATAAAAAAARAAAAAAATKSVARPMTSTPVAVAPAKPVLAQAPPKPTPLQSAPPPQLVAAPTPTSIQTVTPVQLHVPKPVPQPPVSVPMPATVVPPPPPKMLQPQPLVPGQALPRRSDFVVGTRVMIRHTADLVACGARNLVGKTGRIVAVPQVYGQEVYSVYVDEHETMFQVPFNALVVISPPAPTPIPISMQHQPPPRSMHQLTSSGMVSQAQSLPPPTQVLPTSLATQAPAATAVQAAMRPTPSIEDVKLEHSYQLHRLMQQQYREIQVLQQQYAECRLVNPAALPSIQKELSKLRLVHLSQVQTLKSKQALDLLGK